VCSELTCWGAGLGITRWRESFNLPRPPCPRQADLLPLPCSPQSCLEHNEWQVAAKSTQCSSCLSLLGILGPTRRKKLSSPHREGIHSPQLCSNHMCDIQVSSSHSRPPIQPAQLPLEPTKRWLRKQTDLSAGRSQSRKARSVGKRVEPASPQTSWRISHKSSYHYF